MEKEMFCDICASRITNPMCGSCYLNHLELWMNDNNIPVKSRNEIKKKIKSKILKETGSEEECVLCHDEPSSICAFCFYFQTSLIVKKIVNKKMMDSYNVMFNYEAHEENGVERTMHHHGTAFQEVAV